MEPGTENRIVVITRKTRLDELKARFNTLGQAKFYVEHLGADFSDYELEDANYRMAVRRAREVLSLQGRVHAVDRSFLPNYMFGPGDTVVAVGQDGLVANVLKYLDHHLLIGVNPDPERWEGVLLPFTVDDLGTLMPEVFAGTRPVSDVSMAEARLNTGERIFAVNDLFIGPKSHTSARYDISIGERSEYHSSSGIIVSTGLGSTGWLRSILAGAAGVASAISQEELHLDTDQAVAWDSEFLFFSVREPWPSNTSGADITFGRITAAQPLSLVSRMPENGVIFSDGMESDYLAFNSGTEAVITVSGRKGHLVT